jgi:uncharacterized membrane protein
MVPSPNPWTDYQVEQVLGNLLRIGVITAAVLVLAGGIVYLVHEGNKPPDYREFKGVAPDLRSPIGIVDDALEFKSSGLIQLGLLVLIATPVARVIFSVFAFLWQRDFTYVIITLIVLVVLLYSLFHTELGANGG